MKRELREESKREENREKIKKIRELRKDERDLIFTDSFFRFSLVLGIGVIFKGLFSIIHEGQYGYAILIALLLYCQKKLVDGEFEVRDQYQDKEDSIKEIEDEMLENRDKRLNKKYNYMEYLEN